MGSNSSKNEQSAISSIVNNVVQTNLTKISQEGKIGNKSIQYIRFVGKMIGCKGSFVNANDMVTKSLATMDMNVQNTVAQNIASDITTAVDNAVKQKNSDLNVFQFNASYNKQNVQTALTTIVQNAVQTTQTSMYRVNASNRQVIDIVTDCINSDLTYNNTAALTLHSEYMSNLILNGMQTNASTQSVAAALGNSSDQTNSGIQLMIILLIIGVTVIVVAIVAYKIRFGKGSSGG